MVACTGASAAPASPAAAETRYRVGDFVVYRFTGELVGAPVVLQERVTARDVNRLRIDIRAERAGELRRWVQVVTDTPDNQRNNRIDALYEVREGRYVHLENRANADLLRLYDWMAFNPDGPSFENASRACTEQLGGVAFSCACTESKAPAAGGTVHLKQSECADFLWTHGPATIVEEGTGKLILRAEVVKFGNQAVAAPEPLHPISGAPAP